jgi:hypothetical protein
VSRSEYLILLGLVMLGVLALPAFRDTALIQSVAIALCGGSL